MTEHQRRSIRLREYDYASAGAYFVTICSYQRQLLFEEPATIAVVSQCWAEIPTHHPTTHVDEFVVMPNHVHGVVFIDGRSVGAQHAAPLRRLAVQSGSLGSIVRSFKSAVTKALHEAGTDGPIWQRNYYERVIRDEAELLRVREYIRFNPMKWDSDRENPQRPPDAQHDSDWSWLEGT